MPQPAWWSGAGFKTRCRHCDEETREHEKHQERLCLRRSPITLPNVPCRVDENGNRCRPRSDVALGKPKNEIRDAQEPREVHQADAPHDGAEGFCDTGKDKEDAGRLVVPELAVESLTAKQFAPNDEEGSLVAADRIADIGKRADGHKRPGSRQPRA